MAHFGKDLDNFSSSRTIGIKSTEIGENFTIYVIEVKVGNFTWTVKHRYSDFLALHEKLVTLCKLDKTLLPPKKLFGNQNEAFIKKRKTELEAYLQTILYCVAHKVPSPLAAFLDFDKYEIHGITQNLAEELYIRGDQLLQTREVYEVTPLQLYSLTERLKLPEPTCDSGDVKKDIGHILDFITRVKHLEIKGGTTPVGTSNIDMSKLKFDLTLFKSLQQLKVTNSDALHITGLEPIKQTLEKLTLHHCLASIKNILLQELPHWRSEDGTLLVAFWEHLLEADFSHNSISEIDESVQLMPNVEALNLTHNHISTIQNLNWLSCLTHLDLSYNTLKILDALHTKLGNLKYLNLAGNRIECLHGFSKLFSLESLDISNNQISQMTEVQHLSKLPCLEFLTLVQNPVTTVLDYRTKVLSMFSDRAAEVTLDKEKGTQKELDTVAILLAIQKSKENRNRKSSQKSLEEAQFSSTPVNSGEACTEDQSNTSEFELSIEMLHGTSQPQSQEGEPSTLQRHPSVSETSRKMSESLTFLQQAPPESKDQTTSHSEFSDSYDESFEDTLQSQPKSSSPSVVPERQRSRGHSSSEAPLISLLSIARLPLCCNTAFTQWLQGRLFGNPETESGAIVEPVLHFLWCNVLQYSRAQEVTPCCAVLTERRLFLLRLKPGSCGFSGVPDMETFYIVPVSNLRQVLAGPCYCYIRIEESFVGASGTFVLVASDSDKGKAFVDCLVHATSSTGEEKFDFLNHSQTSAISSYVFSEEDDEDLCTGRMVVASVVKITGTNEFGLLLLSENKVYLVKDDCLFWPKPSFIDKLEDIKSQPNFTFYHKHSIMSNVSDIKIGGVEPVNHRHSRTPSYSGKVPTVEFERYQLSLVFHELIGPVGLHVSFLSLVARDSFLDQLTNLRSEQMNRVSPTIREAPEGGNDSSDSSDSPDNDKNSSPLTDSDETVVRPFRSQSMHPVSLKLQTSLYSNSSFKEMDLMYLTPELQKQLENCIKNHNLVKKISQRLAVLTEMNGEELARYFHSDVALINTDFEQLHYALWSVVSPYKDPYHEIVTCVLMSTKAVYFVSDQVVISPSSGRQAWMTHSRHRSDSIIAFQKKAVDVHHSSGIIHNGRQNPSIIRCYHVYNYSDLKQVHVGLFDQCVRLTGNDSDSTFTLLTRDSAITAQFLHQLKTMLSIFISSPLVDKSPNDIEQDFYRAFDKRTRTTLEGMEYTHPSKVQFFYPGEDTMTDLLFIITERLGIVNQARRKVNILMYILCYLATQESQCGIIEQIESRSILLTNRHICLLKEDVGSYPLPTFVRGLPSAPRYLITDIRKIDSLKRVLFFRDEPKKLTMIFSDDPDEIVVDASVEHFSVEDDKHCHETIPEVGMTLLVQSDRDMKKFMSLLQNQWKDLQPGTDLEIHIL